VLDVLLFVFRVNPDDDRKPNRLGEPAFELPALRDFCVCIPMFAFRFHVQLAAKPH
jgi:hypothetical protein